MKKNEARLTTLPWLLGLGLLLIPGCFESEREVCSTGLVCTVGMHCTAQGDACVRDSCGDGVKQDGEVCDDGNVLDGDRCSANCESDETCGNGVVDNRFGNDDPRNEVCDDGGTDPTDHWEEAKGTRRCSADCKSTQICGNNIVDKPFPEGDPRNEVCDNDFTNTNGDGCSADCKSDESCGNNVVDNRFGEGDPRNEVCDDGGTDDTDHWDEAKGTLRCSGDCKSTQVCGNNIVDKPFPEGDPRNEVCDNDIGGVDGDGCSSNCQSDESCGNLIVDDKFGPGDPRNEACDDGNRVDGDHCSSDCLHAAACGNFVVDMDDQCDDGPTGSSICDADCTFAYCGDGSLNVMRGEACDAGDGSPRDTAGCNYDCTEASCGDGHVNYAAGEQCDGGMLNDPLVTGCNAQCQRISCGDHRVDPGEDCDDGSGGVAQNTLTCDADCTWPAHGDFHVNPAFEECDDGPFDTSRCNFLSLPGTSARCGDGYWNRQTREQCDAGANTAECNANCTIAVCGDGYVGLGEQCDTRGNTAECYKCRFSVCGDNVINPLTEQCERGSATETKVCNKDCTTSRCGDGKVNATAGEQCDGTPGCNPPLNTPGHSDAQPECSAVVCGDGIVNEAAGEVCDHPSRSFGLALGQCTPGCRAGRCGDGAANVDGESGVPDECDNGRDNSDSAYGADSCTRGCKRGFRCGDGNTTHGERCDDRNDNGKRGRCSRDCAFYCADGIMNGPQDVCDGDTPPPICSQQCD
ncbi:MAG: DUF4215 domain-containing protein [Myxococcota bacterium]